MPHRADTRLLGMAAFADFIVVYFRRDGLTGLRILAAERRRAGDRVRRADLPGRAGTESRVRLQPVPAVLHLADHAGLGLRLRHGHRRADPAQAPAGAAVPVGRAVPAARTTSSTASGRSRPTARGSRSRWSAARARRATAVRRACCTATAATRSPGTRPSPSRSCRCSTGGSSTRSRTSGAAASWAGPGTPTASCCTRRTPSPTSSRARSTWRSPAGRPRPGWWPGAARRAAC